MQREFTENWNKLCQCATRTATDVAELNINLLNRLTKTGPLGLGETPKKPEDLFHVVNNMYLEGMKYTQDLSNIYVENIQQFSKVWGDVMRETQANASKVVKGAVKIRDKESA
jgi:hypothetical protein